MSKLNKIILALALCLCIIMSGSSGPFYAYASLGGDEYTDIGEDDYSEDYSDGNQEDEPEDLEAQYADEIDEITKKLEALEKEKRQIQAGIDSTLGEMEKKKAEVNSIGRQISITQEEIAALMERIDFLEKDIANTEARIERKTNDIDNKQSEIDQNYDILRKRLRASYMQDTSTTLGLIFGADSFSDFLSRIEYVKRIAQHDRNLLADLTDQRTELEEQRESLEESKGKLEEFKNSVEDDKEETESKKQVLGVQIGKAQGEMQDLQEMERAYRADMANKKKIEAAFQAELDQIYREIEWSKNAYAGGPMAWPIPAYTIPGKGVVTCEVGPRFGGSDYHTGIDLSGTGINGSNIVAVQDGTIVKANWSYSRGVGYGIYVMIDHGVNEKGQSVSTLYGHMSNISVQVGQTVKRGQVIGQVGSTGWSTGPHLHLEVRLNGSWVNPRPYLFG